MRHNFATRLVITIAALFAAGLIGSRAMAQPVNGGFETGNLTGWTRSGFIVSNGLSAASSSTFQTYRAGASAGSAVVDDNGALTQQSEAFANGTTSTSPILPTQGNFLGYVSDITSVGNTGVMTGSSISQTFIVPAGATSIRADVRFLNIDTPGSAFITFNDFGGIALSQGATVLSQFNFNLNPAVPADVHVTPGVGAGGFGNSTPWQSPTFSLAGMAGQSVTLTAYVASVGDNYAESRLLIDNITVVPEPTLAAMSVLGLLPFLRRARVTARGK